MVVNEGKDVLIFSKNGRVVKKKKEKEEKT